MKEDEFTVTQQESSMQVGGQNSSINQQESSPQVVESVDEEMTSEELLDLFINGSIDAVDSKDRISRFNIADLNIGSEGVDSYSIGEKIDLDNDGENELIKCENIFIGFFITVFIRLYILFVPLT